MNDEGTRKHNTRSGLCKRGIIYRATGRRTDKPSGRPTGATERTRLNTIRKNKTKTTHTPLSHATSLPRMGCLFVLRAETKPSRTKTISSLPDRRRCRQCAACACDANNSSRPDTSGAPLDRWLGNESTTSSSIADRASREASSSVAHRLCLAR